MLAQMTAEADAWPSVHTVATLAAQLSYRNKNMLQVAVLLLLPLRRVFAFTLCVGVVFLVSGGGAAAAVAVAAAADGDADDEDDERILADDDVGNVA